MALGSTLNRNEYQRYLLGGKRGRSVELTILPPSCADRLEIWEPQLPGTLLACNMPVQGFNICLLNKLPNMGRNILLYTQKS